MHTLLLQVCWNMAMHLASTTHARGYSRPFVSCMLHLAGLKELDTVLELV